MVTFELHEVLICLLDPLKPHFYYMSTGLRGSFSHGDISIMVPTNETQKLKSVSSYYPNVSVLIKFSQKTSVFTFIIISSP